MLILLHIVHVGLELGGSFSQFVQMEEKGRALGFLEKGIGPLRWYRLRRKGCEEGAVLEGRGTSAHAAETLCASVLSAVEWGQDRIGQLNLERPLHRASTHQVPRGSNT